MFACILPEKAVPKMIYIVLGGTLNPTHSLTILIIILVFIMIDNRSICNNCVMIIMICKWSFVLLTLWLWKRMWCQSQTVHKTICYWCIVHRVAWKLWNIQGAAEKSGPPNFFAVFSATVYYFNMKFYSFIYWNLLHLTAKWNVILLKNDEVIDFLTWPPTDFSAFKNVYAKNAI